MKKTTIRIVFGVLALTYVLTHFLGHAHASSLGIGTNEATVPSTGLFGEWLNWINLQQQDFYRSLTGALKGMREDGSRLWVLVGLSFAYGVFHAAGPGHGKAVISSYMLANEVALQARHHAFLRLGLPAGDHRDPRHGAGVSGAARHVGFDDRRDLVSRSGELCADHAVRRMALVAEGRPAAAFAGRWQPGLQPVGRARAFSCTHEAMRTRIRTPPIRMATAMRRRIRTAMRDMTIRTIIRGTITRPTSTSISHHATGEVCETCGHSHAPDPAMLSGDRFSWKTAWSAVAAVGLRPCSGALIVLTFAFLNGLFVGGVLSVFAMAVGTAITVSVLATLAVTAKNWAVAYAGDGRAGQPGARDDRDRRRGDGVCAGPAAA